MLMRLIELLLNKGKVWLVGFVGVCAEYQTTHTVKEPPSSLYCDWVNSWLIIECQKISHKVVYCKWFVPNRRYVSYKLKAITSEPKPKHLSELSSEYSYYPSLLERVLYGDLCSKIAVNAYLETLM